jgi:PGF-pre-PGF domain-containing protein
MTKKLVSFIYEKTQKYNMLMVKAVRILNIYNRINLPNTLSNSTLIKKYFSIIMGIIFLFSIFSSLFIPVLCAKNVSIESDSIGDSKKDVGVSSTPVVEKTSSTPVVEKTSSTPVVEKTSSTPVVEKTSSTPVVEKTSSTPVVSVVSDDSDDNGSSITVKNNKAVTKSFKLRKNEMVETNENETNDEIELTLESNIGNVTENDKISVEISEEEKPSAIIKKVDFSSSRNQQNVKLKVSNLKGEPAEIKNELNISTSANVYKYLNIKLTAGDTYIGETGIRSMNFTFTVNKSWVEHNDIDKDTVTMMRYHNDTWQELNTTYVNETDDEMTFKAITPGLSIFAVVGDKVVEESDEIIIETTNVPWWMPATIIFASTATLGLVIFKKGFIYSP